VRLRNHRDVIGTRASSRRRDGPVDGETTRSHILAWSVQSYVTTTMNARNFLFVSADAVLITNLAWQVHEEGHEAKYYIEAESDREIGDGFVPKTDDWRADVE